MTAPDMCQLLSNVERRNRLSDFLLDDKDRKTLWFFDQKKPEKQFFSICFVIILLTYNQLYCGILNILRNASIRTGFI